MTPTTRKVVSVLLAIPAIGAALLALLLGWEGFFVTHHGWGAEVAMAEAMLKAFAATGAIVALVLGSVAYLMWPRAPKKHTHDHCQQCGHTDTH